MADKTKADLLEEIKQMKKDHTQELEDKDSEMTDAIKTLEDENTEALEAVEEKNTELEADLKKAKAIKGVEEPTAVDVPFGRFETGEIKTYYSLVKKHLISVPSGRPISKKTDLSPEKPVQFLVHQYKTNNLLVQHGIENHHLFGKKLFLAQNAPAQLKSDIDQAGTKYTKGDATTADTRVASKQ